MESVKSLQTIVFGLVMALTLNAWAYDQEVVVIPVRFTDTATDVFSLSQINAMMNTDADSVTAFYKEGTFDNVSIKARLTVDATGAPAFINIPYNSKTCINNTAGTPDYFLTLRTWGSVAESIANSYGNSIPARSSVVTSGKRVFLYNSSSVCGRAAYWGNWGDMPGNSAWVNLANFSYSSTNYDRVAKSLKNTIVHELGHNLGIAHAAAMNGINRVPTRSLYGNTTASNSFYDERGDWTDVMNGSCSGEVMGGQSYKQFNALHKLGKNWISANSVNNVPAPVDGSAQSFQFTIKDSEYASAIGEAQIIKIPKKDTGEYYYVSFRQPSQLFDASFLDYNLFSKTNQDRSGGMFIHVWNGTLGADTSLVNGWRQDGNFLYDNVNKIVIKQETHTTRYLNQPGTATITVAFNSAPPADTILPEIGYGMYTFQSSKGTLDIDVTAYDNVAISSVTLKLDSNIFYNQTFSSQSSFQSIQIPLNVSSYTTGYHVLNSVIVDTSGNTSTFNENVYIANSGVTVVTTVPVLPTVKISNPVANSTVSGNVAVSISGNSSVSSVLLKLDGVQLSSASGSALSYSLNTLNFSNGLHTLSTEARDSSGNLATASVQITINNVVAPAPVVDATAPAVSQLVLSSNSRNVTLSASASDGGSGIVRVEFYDGSKMISATQYSSALATASASSNVNLRKMVAGTHNYQVRFIDASGNIGYSNVVSFTKP
jgi:hypothetical protein